MGTAEPEEPWTLISGQLSRDARLHLQEQRAWISVTGLAFLSASSLCLQTLVER